MSTRPAGPKQTGRTETVMCLDCGDTQDTTPTTFATGILAARCEQAGHSCRPVIASTTRTS